MRAWTCTQLRGAGATHARVSPARAPLAGRRYAAVRFLAPPKGSGPRPVLADVRATNSSSCLCRRATCAVSTAAFAGSILPHDSYKCSDLRGNHPSGNDMNSPQEPPAAVCYARRHPVGSGLHTKQGRRSPRTQYVYRIRRHASSFCSAAGSSGRPPPYTLRLYVMLPTAQLAVRSVKHANGGREQGTRVCEAVRWSHGCQPGALPGTVMCARLTLQIGEEAPGACDASCSCTRSADSNGALAARAGGGHHSP